MANNSTEWLAACREVNSSTSLDILSTAIPSLLSYTILLLLLTVIYIITVIIIVRCLYVPISVCLSAVRCRYNSGGADEQGLLFNLDTVEMFDVAVLCHADCVLYVSS
jgi:hypothetical protein